MLTKILTTILYIVAGTYFVGAIVVFVICVSNLVTEIILTKQ